MMIAVAVEETTDYQATARLATEAFASTDVVFDPEHLRWLYERCFGMGTTVVSLTDAAASKLQELTKEESNPDIGLRVYVYSGGCSGR